MNRCLTEEMFPQALKITKILPIYKKGDNTSFANYRPIAIIPVFSKILEALVYIRVLNFVQRNNILTEHQHGYRKNKKQL